MLVIRTKHFWLGSAPARRSGHGIMRVQLLMAQSAERELGMAWLWPERLDIEVPAAVCSAATMGALGRIPVETRSRRRVRTGSSPLTGAASVSFARQLAECFAALLGGTDVL